MTTSLVSKFLFCLMASVSLAGISAPAFAQRGGGGFHGGGGFRGGGGTGSRGGGFSGGYRGMSAPRSGGGYAGPGAPGGYAYSGSRSMRPGPWSGTGRPMAPGRSLRSPNPDGRGSPLARRGNTPGSATPPRGIRPEPNGGAWQSFNANRAPAVRSAPVRGSTVPNGLEAKNSISQVRALSSIRRAFGNSDVGNLRFGSNPSVSASSRFSSSAPARLGGTALSQRTALNSLTSGFAFNRFGFRNFDRFPIFDRFRFHPPFAGFPFRDFDDFFFFRSPFFFNNFSPFNNFFPFNSFFFQRPFFGCFGCGFGFVGLNFGFGAPLWWGSGWPGWFGRPGYLYGPPYGYSLPYDVGLTYDSSAAGGPQSDNSSGSSAFARTPKSAENSSALLQLYLKDGTMYSARDCWLADGKLHCTGTDLSEGVVELDAIDFQRTVDENAKRGVPFTLKPKPTSSKPAY